MLKYKDEMDDVRNQFGNDRADVYKVIGRLNSVRDDLETIEEVSYNPYIPKTEADAFIFDAAFHCELYAAKINNQYQEMRRGEIWRCELGEHSLGSEMRYMHPALVIQHSDPAIDPSQDRTHSRFCNVIVVPLTHADSLTNRPFSLVEVDAADLSGEILNQKQGYVDVANMRCVSRARLTKKIGEMHGDTLKRVEKAIVRILGMNDMDDLWDALQRQINTVELKETQKRQYRTAMEEIRRLLGTNPRIRSSDTGKKILKLIETTMNNY